MNEPQRSQRSQRQCKVLINVSSPRRSVYAAVIIFRINFKLTPDYFCKILEMEPILKMDSICFHLNSTDLLQQNHFAFIDKIVDLNFIEIHARWQVFGVK